MERGLMETTGHWTQQRIKRIRKPLALVLIPLLLMATGCGRIMGADLLVQRAVTLEVLRSQVAIAQEYSNDDASPIPDDLPVAIDTLDVIAEQLGVRVSHIRVKERLPLTVGDRPGYKISGTYDLDLERDGWNTSQGRSPFEIYLQRQPENKTWKLAHLNPGTPDEAAVWELYRL